MIEMSRPFGSRHFKHFLFEIIHFDANFNFSWGLHFTSFSKFYSYFRCCLERKEIIIPGVQNLGGRSVKIFRILRNHPAFCFHFAIFLMREKPKKKWELYWCYLHNFKEILNYAYLLSSIYLLKESESARKFKRTLSRRH